MAQPSYYEGQYSLPPATDGYSSGQYGYSSGQNAQELGYAGSSYASASATQAAAAPLYTTATTGGSYSMSASAFDPSNLRIDANLGYLSAGQSSLSQGAFGAPSYGQGTTYSQ